MTRILPFEEALVFIRERIETAIAAPEDDTDALQIFADAKHLLDEYDALAKEKHETWDKLIAARGVIESIRTEHAFPSDRKIHREHCDACEAIDDYDRKMNGIAPYEDPDEEQCDL